MIYVTLKDNHGMNKGSSNDTRQLGSRQDRQIFWKYDEKVAEVEKCCVSTALVTRDTSWWKTINLSGNKGMVERWKVTRYIKAIGVLGISK